MEKAKLNAENFDNQMSREVFERRERKVGQAEGDDDFFFS